jgi:aerobic carbon-monoxide dehydrogenase large subunit
LLDDLHAARLFRILYPRSVTATRSSLTLAELPTAVNPLGAKGAGQAGCIAARQTVVNAILDALAPLGIERVDMPATPESGARSGARGADR